MGRDRDYYDLECGSCGSKGEIVTWSDDWNRWGVETKTGFVGPVYVTGPKADILECETCAARNPIVTIRPAP